MARAKANPHAGGAARGAGSDLGSSRPKHIGPNREAPQAGRCVIVGVHKFPRHPGPDDEVVWLVRLDRGSLLVRTRELQSYRTFRLYCRELLGLELAPMSPDDWC